MIVTPPLAALEIVSPRLPWPREAQHFTPWLEKNLSLLAEAIGAPLTLVDAKAAGGAKIADILARDERDGSLVIVENQLEASDDAHLGQILAYAAGLDARAVVWVATGFREPHLAAVRWINAKGAFSFFAVTVKVVRIAGSALAASFEVVERPNGWERALRSAAATPATPFGGFAGAFWAAHLERHRDEETASRPVGERCRWRATKPTGLVIGQLVEPHAVSVFLRGRQGVTLSAARAALEPFADALEARLAVALNGEREAMLAAKALAINVADPGNWPAASDWLREQAQAYDAALRALTGGSARRR